MFKEQFRPQDINQMINICVPQMKKQTKKVKEFEKVCSVFLSQLEQAQKKNSQGENTYLTLTLIRNQKNKNQDESSSSFILACLVYIFIRFKTLKVIFSIPNDHKIKRKSYNSIALTLKHSQNKAKELNPQFYKNIENLLDERRKTLNKQLQNHFEELNFMCKAPYQQSKIQTQQLINLRSDTYTFISEFYRKVNMIYRSEPIYLLKNSLLCFNTQQSLQVQLIQQNRQNQLYCYQQCIRNIKNNYVLVHYFRLHPYFYRSLAHELAKEEINVQQPRDNPSIADESQKGFFKRFEGSQMQYVDKLILYIQNRPVQSQQISQIIKSMPNLSHLQIQNLFQNNNSQTVLPQINLLLQHIIAYNPLIRKISLRKMLVQHIPNEMLLKLYEQCPFLVDLDVNMPFKYSIYQTFKMDNVVDKDIKLQERQAQIILEAMKMRNISLTNNIDMAKLLLKKGYNYNLALQIIDCIEPICI